jgi:putative ABC transport system ATP-binding protein
MTVRGENISKQFMRKGKGTNCFYAVENCDFTLSVGKITVIMGRSGSGKSTFLNMLSGLLAPTSGKIFYGDTDIYSLDDKQLSLFRNENIGVIPQGQTALQSLTVLENVCMPATLYGGPAKCSEYALHLLEKLGIAELRDSMPSELSGGELRRMSIARAMVNDPSVILADEPTGDLDDENTEIVLKLLKGKAAEGVSVFLVTHENEAKDYADDFYVMKKGVICKGGNDEGL